MKGGVGRGEREREREELFFFLYFFVVAFFLSHFVTFQQQKLPFQARRHPAPGYF
jgi:hypothetical protein